MDRIVVAGGGVLGAMHAAQARRLGHEVVHLEREAGARGAGARGSATGMVNNRPKIAESAI
jgi:glycine/D-amino acid oxidase-like deaminating enzyme